MGTRQWLSREQHVPRFVLLPRYLFLASMPAPTYLTQHQNRFLEELIDWLRIPSVSADPKFHGDVLQAADFLA